MIDSRLEKAQLLINQDRYKEAQKLLDSLIKEDPTDVRVLYMMAEVYLQQDQYLEANSIIDSAIGLSPESAFLMTMKARIALSNNKYDKAESHLKHAIRMDPLNAYIFALLASVKMTRKSYDEALDLADKALALDGENLMALNVRSSALNKLDRNEESFTTIEGALRNDPNNAYTHANYGWNLLEQGKHKEALEHFKESLSKDPSFKYAQSGLLEALKASNPIYRAFLKYAFWIGNLTAKYQWGVIIGFYFLFRILRNISEKSEALKPFLTPLLIVMGILAFSTWIIGPVSNLFLRFNKYGQLLLSAKEKISSNFVALSFGVGCYGLILYFIFREDTWLALTIFGFTMMLPCSVMLSTTKSKNLLLVYTIGLTLVGIIAIIKIYTGSELTNNMATLYVLAYVAFQWVANFMIIGEDNV